MKEAVPEQDQLLNGPLRLRIDYSFQETTDLDTDNIIKPIQDALEALIYEDDKTVVDVCARKVNRQRLPPFVDPPATVSDALTSVGGEFVYVGVAAAHRETTFS